MFALLRLQLHEALDFVKYMGSKTLYIDVWDADAQMHVGTMAVPLRALLRQSQPAVKETWEYEVRKTRALRSL